MTKVKQLNWLQANDTIYAAPLNSRFIYYIKSLEDGTFELDQLDTIKRVGTITFHAMLDEAKDAANLHYINETGSV